MNWQTYLPTPEQIEADNALVDTALEKITNFFKIQFDGMTGEWHRYLAMKIEIETPVMKPEGYPSEMHRLGVVIALDGQRAQVQWMAREFLTEPKYGARVKVKTWCKIESLKVWPESLRVRLCDEHVTLCADGMEYTTPRA